MARFKLSSESKMHDIGCLRPFAELKLSFWLFGPFFWTGLLVSPTK